MVREVQPRVAYFCAIASTDEVGWGNHGSHLFDDFSELAGKLLSLHGAHTGPQSIKGLTFDVIHAYTALTVRGRMHIVHGRGWYSSLSGDLERLRFSDSYSLPRLGDSIIRLQDNLAVEELVQYKGAYFKLAGSKASSGCRQPGSTSSSDSDSSDDLARPLAFLLSRRAALYSDSPGCLPRERDTAYVPDVDSFLPSMPSVADIFFSFQKMNRGQGDGLLIWPARRGEEG